MMDRIMGVLKLDVPTYEAIEHDESATQQAAIIVLVVAIIAAIGGWLQGSAFSNLGNLEGLEEFGAVLQNSMSPAGLAINAFIGTFVGWVVWSYVTYFIGTRMFDGKATPQEMLRVLGFAMVPRVLSIIPCLGIIGA
ncbi:MAG: YIP1 family protein, partial [Chloroflexota bacterium]